MINGNKRIAVSVIVPVYNMEKYLPQCLDSLYRQTFTNFEVICINDGSTDKSAEIISKYAAEKTNILVVEQENAGLSVARNVGIKKAKGKYICFLDSDDKMHEKALETLYNKAEKQHLDILFSSADIFFEKKTIEEEQKDFTHDKYVRKGKYDSALNGKDLIVKMHKNDDYIVSACLLITRRQFLLENNIYFYDGILHEDNLFVFTALINAKKANVMNEITYHRRVRENSIMTVSKTYKNLYGYYITFLNVKKIAEKTKFTVEQKNIVYKNILYSLIYHITNLYNILDEQQRNIFIEKLTFDEKALFESIFANYIAMLNYENHVLNNEIKRINEAKENEIVALRSSYAFKIGRIFTFIPRKLRNFRH